MPTAVMCTPSEVDRVIIAGHASTNKTSAAIAVMT